MKSLSLGYILPFQLKLFSVSGLALLENNFITFLDLFMILKKLPKTHPFSHPFLSLWESIDQGAILIHITGSVLWPNIQTLTLSKTNNLDRNPNVLRSY